MANTSDLRLDAEELRKLLATAERQRVKDTLTIELRKVETEITRLEEEIKKSGENTANEPAVPLAKPTQSRIPTVDIKNYAWDQSEKFMKIYANVPGIESVPKENITCSFRESLRCEAVNNKNYTCEVSHLMEAVVPDESLYKIKTNTVLVMLKKRETGKTWPYITQTEKRIKDKPSKPSLDKDADPNDSLMSMMKQMYEDGDDEMKRTIAKAWTESREKQARGDMAL